LPICQWKNFENLSTFAVTIIKSPVSCMCCFYWDTVYTFAEWQTSVAKVWKNVMILCLLLNAIVWLCVILGSAVFVLPYNTDVWQTDAETDRHMTTAYTVLKQRRGKKRRMIETYSLWNANSNSYVLYRLALFSVTLSDHNYPQTTPFSIFCITFHIFVWVEIDFKFGKWVDRSKCSPTDDKWFRRGVWSGPVNHLNFVWIQPYLWNGWSYSGQILHTGRLCQVTAYWWQQTPKRGTAMVTWLTLIFWAPVISLERLS